MSKNDSPDTITEVSKSDWKPISEQALDEFFCGGGDVDKTDWSALDYCQPRNHEWYRNKFPGFPEDIIEILVKCDGTYQDPESTQNTWDKKQKLNAAIELRKEKTTIHFD